MDGIFPLWDRVNQRVHIVEGEARSQWLRKKEQLQNRQPTDDYLLNRWWRNRTLSYIKRHTESKGRKRITQQDLTLEDKLWTRYPHLRLGWIKHRLNLMPFVPSKQQLRDQWWQKRQREFMRRRGEIQSTPHLRKSFRLNVFFKRLVYCNHIQCYGLRLSFLFWLIMHSIVLSIY